VDPEPELPPALAARRRGCALRHQPRSAARRASGPVDRISGSLRAAGRAGAGSVGSLRGRPAVFTCRGRS
jgi:hypothetical protein